MRTNPKALIELGLNENYLGDAGASAVAEMLQVNNVLTTLWLGDNMIGDEGAIVSACIYVCALLFFGGISCAEPWGILSKPKMYSI